MIVEQLAAALGSWRGVNRMRILPTDPYSESAAEATITITAGGFVTVSYTWSESDAPQNGLLLIGDVAEADQPGESKLDGANRLTAVWVDSWHSPSVWMTLQGRIEEDGGLLLAGSYPAPPGPDWGWQIGIAMPSEHEALLTMHNVMLGEEPYQVVEAVYER